MNATCKWCGKPILFDHTENKWRHKAKRHGVSYTCAVRVVEHHAVKPAETEWNDSK